MHRTQLLRPYIRRVVGTRCAVDVSQIGILAAYAGDGEMKDVSCMPADCAHAWMCADWLIRTYTPAWLRLAGRDTAFSAPRPWLGGPAVRDAFKAVPWLAPDAPDSQIDHIVQIAMGNAGAAMEAVVHAAAREAGWNDILEAERRATRDMAVEAARRARREILQAAPTVVRRAARDAKRAAPRWERDMRKADERMTRRSAEEAARRTVGPAVGPYVWIRAKAAGWAAVRDSRTAMNQYSPPAIRDAARAAAQRAYHDVEHTAHWQPALAAAQVAAQRALAPTIAELQNSACDLLDRLTTA